MVDRAELDIERAISVLNRKGLYRFPSFRYDGMARWILLQARIDRRLVTLRLPLASEHEECSLKWEDVSASCECSPVLDRIREVSLHVQHHESKLTLFQSLERVLKVVNDFSPEPEACLDDICAPDSQDGNDPAASTSQTASTPQHLSCPSPHAVSCSHDQPTSFCCAPRTSASSSSSNSSSSSPATTCSFCSSHPFSSCTHSIAPQSTLLPSSLLSALCCHAEDHDMMLSLIASAARSYRRAEILHPVPPLSHSLQADKHTEFSEIDRAVRKIPPLSLVRTQPDVFRSLPTTSVSVLSWLVNSRCRLKHTAVDGSLLAIGQPRGTSSASANALCRFPDYQFDVELPDDPYFEALAAKHGKIIGFHGSPTENWYSILFQGLVSMSGTRRMTSGALYGDGIYLTDSLQLARMFTKPAHTSESSMFGSRVEIVGVFEAVDSPAAIKRERQGPGSRESGKASRKVDSVSRTQDGDGLQGKGHKVDDEKMPPHYIVVKEREFLRLRSLLVYKHEPAHTHRALASWALLLYVCVLLLVVLAQVDWSVWRKWILRQYWRR